MAEKVLQLTKSKSKLVFMPLPEDDPKQRQPNITMAKEKLDWQPKAMLEDGLKETIAYFQQFMKFYNHKQKSNGFIKVFRTRNAS
ncbi:MAG: hypothetical protein PHG00_14830 [Methylococcales bacterium]|nr:hypothetical protein [Methylococcales bacterium]